MKRPVELLVRPSQFLSPDQLAEEHCALVVIHPVNDVPEAQKIALGTTVNGVITSTALTVVDKPARRRQARRLRVGRDGIFPW